MQALLSGMHLMGNLIEFNTEWYDSVWPIPNVLSQFASTPVSRDRASTSRLLAELSTQPWGSRFLDRSRHDSQTIHCCNIAGNNNIQKYFNHSSTHPVEQARIPCTANDLARKAKCESIRFCYQCRHWCVHWYQWYHAKVQNFPKSRHGPGDGNKATHRSTGRCWKGTMRLLLDLPRSSERNIAV